MEGRRRAKVGKTQGVGAVPHAHTGFDTPSSSPLVSEGGRGTVPHGGNPEVGSYDVVDSWQTHLVLRRL